MLKQLVPPQLSSHLGAAFACCFTALFGGSGLGLDRLLRLLLLIEGDFFPVGLVCTKLHTSR